MLLILFFAENPSKLIQNYESEDIQIFADPDQIHQVAVNLLINASQAISKEGIIEINTTIVNNEEIKFTNLPNGNYAKVVIHDNGPGIPDYIKNRIFEPYFSTKPDGNGIRISYILFNNSKT